MLIVTVPELILQCCTAKFSFPFQRAGGACAPRTGAGAFLHEAKGGLVRLPLFPGNANPTAVSETPTCGTLTGFGAGFRPCGTSISLWACSGTRASVFSYHGDGHDVRPCREEALCCHHGSCTERSHLRPIECHCLIPELHPTAGAIRRRKLSWFSSQVGEAGDGRTLDPGVPLGCTKHPILQQCNSSALLPC